MKFACGECSVEVEARARPITCDKCNCWNTFEEIEDASAMGIKFQAEPICIDDIESKEVPRYVTGMAPFDDVTGGGPVKGAVYLLAGEPGIGKSTLLWQVLKLLKVKTMYASAEENAEQIKMTTNRVNVSGKHITFFNESNVERIIEYAKKLRIKVLVADSIQVMWTDACKSAVGSTSQVRDSGNAFVAFAKTKGITVILVGHVTKDETIAGPKTIQHMVDCPLFFSLDESNERVRILKATKNRFGDTSVRGIFEMGPNGLIPYATRKHDQVKLVAS